jgi:hypothetical protein
MKINVGIILIFVSVFALQNPTRAHPTISLFLYFFYPFMVVLNKNAIFALHFEIPF